MIASFIICTKFIILRSAFLSQNENEESSESKEESKKGCADIEILAILGHELGHWKLNHVLKNLIIGQVSFKL